MSKILKNQTVSPIPIADVGGVIIPATPATYTIPPQDYLLWAASSDIITYLNDTSPTPSIIVNDGSFDLNPSDGMDLIKGLYPRYYVFTPLVQYISIPTANTEATYAFATDTRRIMLLNESDGIVKLSYTSGQSGTVYVSIYKNMFYSESFIGAGTTTIYVQCPVAAKTLKAVSWV